MLVNVTCLSNELLRAAVRNKHTPQNQTAGSCEYGVFRVCMANGRNRVGSRDRCAFTNALSEGNHATISVNGSCYFLTRQIRCFHTSGGSMPSLLVSQLRLL